jgi:hypothetical protein
MLQEEGHREGGAAMRWQNARKRGRSSLGRI